ncbi:hypothetical protein L8C58_00610 [Streptomyces sp. CMAA1738]|nr:hypothetical protein [Streptomyces sp. CMAA1738]MEC4569626.1 hypothetical protein [Streptomyces sp. CMAA1738]
MDSAARFIGHFVCGVLNELEKLAIAVTALGDTTFSICMLGDETRVHGVRLQDTRGLFENGLNDRRGR